MRPYLHALVLSVSLIATDAFAQMSPTYPAQPRKLSSGLPPLNFTPRGYVNIELQQANEEIQHEVLKLVSSGKLINETNQYRTGKKTTFTDKVQEGDLDNLNRVSQRIANGAVVDTQLQKRLPYNEKKTEETPEPITKLSPSMRKSGNDDTAITAELYDGQHVVFRDNGSVMIMDERGRAKLPPDGLLTLKDGTTFKVKRGMRTE